MKNVSPEFYAQITKKRNFEYTVTVHFDEVGVNDVVLHNEDLMISGCEITNSSESSSFPLGNAIAKTLTLVLPNHTGKWDKYNFYGASVHVILKNHIDVLNKDEYVDLGTYRVITPETPGSTIEITAVDYMYLADVPFASTSSNITLANLFDEVCQYCNLTAEKDTSGNIVCANGSFVVKEVPTDLTCRDMLGYIACIACGNAQILPKTDNVTTIDAYTVHICTYDFSKFGNIWDGDVLNDFTNPKILDGGDFTFANDTDTVSGGSYADTEEYHMLSYMTSLTYSTDDVVITGLKTVNDEDTVITTTPFDDNYVLVIDNPLIKGDEQTALNLMGPYLLGYQFRPFEMEHISYPLADLGDVCRFIDRKNHIYISLLTDITYLFKGATSFKCSVEDPLKANASYTSKSMQAVEQARRDTTKQISNYDIAVQRMNELAVNSLGYYESFETDSVSGGRISYIHDKPNRVDSTIIYKRTIDGFFVSNDGGQTYVSGFDASGNAVFNILNAIGINADWIKAGSLFLSGKNNGVTFNAYNYLYTLNNQNNSGTNVFTLFKFLNEYSPIVDLHSGNGTAEIVYSSSSGWINVETLTLSSGENEFTTKIPTSYSSDKNLYGVRLTGTCNVSIRCYHYAVDIRPNVTKSGSSGSLGNIPFCDMYVYDLYGERIKSTSIKSGGIDSTGVTVRESSSSTKYATISGYDGSIYATGSIQSEGIIQATGNVQSNTNIIASNNLQATNGYVWTKTGGTIGKHTFGESGAFLKDKDDHICSVNDGFRWNGIVHFSESTAYYKQKEIATTGSDRRMKKNIVDISKDKIRSLFSKLDFVKFKYKKDFNETEDDYEHYGVIAQDMIDVFNEVGLDSRPFISETEIASSDGDNMLAVKYGEFIALQGKAIQDLYELLNAQQLEIDKLKELLNDR